MAIKNGWQIWWWWYCCVRWNGILRTNFRCSELNLVNELFIELKMCDVNCVRTKKIKICKREREIGINSTFALAQLLRTTSHFPKEEKAMRTNCENVYGSIISSAQIPLRTVFTRKKKHKHSNFNGSDGKLKNAFQLQGTAHWYKNVSEAAALASVSLTEPSMLYTWSYAGAGNTHTYATGREWVFWEGHKRERERESELENATMKMVML